MKTLSVTISLALALCGLATATHAAGTPRAGCDFHTYTSTQPYWSTVVFADPAYQPLACEIAAKEASKQVWAAHTTWYVYVKLNTGWTKVGCVKGGFKVSCPYPQPPHPIH
jgi:hypothetical protein